MTESDQAAALVAYYHRRAPEYDAIWQRDDPARQEEQAALAAAMRSALRGRRVLEVACGTGHWTAELAGAVHEIVAVDAAPGMLELARRRGLPPSVRLLAGDAYDLGAVPGDFDGGLAMFLVSHVPRARLADLLAGLHRRLGPGAAVFLADNRYIAGVGGKLVDPGGGDTFKRRRLSDGSEHLVLKNYLDAAELSRLLSPGTEALKLAFGTSFWWASYRVAPAR